MSYTLEEQPTIEDTAYLIAPQWAKFRLDMLRSFPSPYKNERDSLADGIEDAIRQLDQLKPEKNGGPAYLGTNPALTIDFEDIKDSYLSPKMNTSTEVIRQVIKLFEGLPNWGHPLTMCNVNPQGNTAAIVAAVLSEIFAPNIGKPCRMGTQKIRLRLYLWWLRLLDVSFKICPYPSSSRFKKERHQN